MSSNAHPYANLPPSRFWRSAVAEVDPLQLDLVWRPRWQISRDTGIVTLGSCFAQHISTALRREGFRWLDAEPAPEGLPPDSQAASGYGVFSFRTGNIYTAALLRQWISWALGTAEPSPESWIENGRHFDPFRPSFPQAGYASAEEMLEARKLSLQAMARGFREADVLVFTLGLTEAWRDTDGTVYPMCPGTIRGEFSAKRHRFHNFTQREVLQDLAGAFDILRNENPRIRFLLTVSPVPLVATASEDHVLVATTYSKSVLRAAAGELAQVRGDVDYFPSYELIASAPLRAQFFESNLRSVRAEGVDFVMKQFLAGVEERAAHRAPDVLNAIAASQTNTEQLRPMPASTEICDEIILETWSKPQLEMEVSPDLLLIGDSHMGMIADVLDEKGVAYAGGALLNGHAWHQAEFMQLDHMPFFLPLAADAKQRWQASCRSFFGDGWDKPREGRWILVNMGCHTRDLFWQGPTGLVGYISRTYGKLPDQIPARDFRAYLTYARTHHVSVLNRFVQAGYQVIFIMDPPTVPVYPHLAVAMDEGLESWFSSIGCKVFSTRAWIESMGGFPAEFRSTEVDATTGEPDWQHGSREYYRRLIDEIFRRFRISPRMARGGQPEKRQQASS